MIKNKAGPGGVVINMEKIQLGGYFAMIALARLLEHF